MRLCDISLHLKYFNFTKYEKKYVKAFKNIISPIQLLPISKTFKGKKKNIYTNNSTAARIFNIYLTEVCEI